MIWAWERRWGSRGVRLPGQLVHTPCGHVFAPELQCAHCSTKTRLSDLRYSLEVNPQLLATATDFGRTPRMSAQSGNDMGLGLRVDRWTLMIITAVVLGCRHFDQLSHVLGIGPSVLAQRLKTMVDIQLLLAQADLHDGRRTVYRLTPASRDLFGYTVCFANWTGRQHLGQPSSIRPLHSACGHAFIPQVACDQCGAAVHAPDVVQSTDHWV
jgi:DNA-binding HxlR family transcriptional regulator